MGAWGMGIFDNDMACDFIYEVSESNDLSVIEKTINTVFEEDYIDSDIGSETLAAIDILARLMGKFGDKNSYTEELDKWVEKQKIDIPQGLIEKSKKAIAIIVDSEVSELHELWAEGDNFDVWKNEVKALEARLNS